MQDEPGVTAQFWINCQSLGRNLIGWKVVKNSEVEYLPLDGGLCAVGSLRSLELSSVLKFAVCTVWSVSVV